MKTYNEFLVEKELQPLNESILYFSPQMREDLGKVRHPIAKAILSMEGTDRKEDITFIDVSPQEGFVTFKTMKSMLNDIEKEAPTPDLTPILKSVETEFNKSNSDTYLVNLPGWKQKRNPIKIGKLINTIFPGKYTPGDIEKFTNKFKVIQKGGSLATIKVIEGDEIIKWYNENNYLESTSSLGGSCMRYDRCATYFDIYTKNPEVCKMVLLLEEDEEGVLKLRARALLWKVEGVDDDLEFEWFLDRQYAISDADALFLTDWAYDNGYAYKTENSFGNIQNVTWDGYHSKIKMQVQLQQKNYNKFPYVDTFKRFDPEECILYNDDEEKNNENQYLLNSTHGGYEEIRGDVYCEWVDEYYPEDQTVYSEHVDSYLPENRATYINRGSRMNMGWWPENHDNVVQDEWHNDSIHINDAYYSEHYGGYILADEAVGVVDYVKKDGNCNEETCWVHENDSCFVRFYGSSIKDSFWYEHLSSKRGYYWEDHNGILKNLIIKDWKDEWILKDFKITLYEVTGENAYEELDYLDEGSAKILGLKLDKDYERVSDVFEYLNLLDTEIGLEKLEEMSKSFSDDEDVKKLLKYINIF
jgi:hypothetical protein